MEDGWIKLHRKLLKWSMYQDSEAVHLWIHLLLEAQHDDYKIYVRTLGKEITLKPGQLLKSIRVLSKETRINKDKVHRLLKDLKNCNGIETVTHGILTCITILNWHEYQKVETDLRQSCDSRETVVIQEQECKNVRKKESYDSSSFNKDKDNIKEQIKKIAKDKNYTGDLDELISRFLSYYNGKEISDLDSAIRKHIEVSKNTLSPEEQQQRKTVYACAKQIPGCTKSGDPVCEKWCPIIKARRNNQ